MKDEKEIGKAVESLKEALTQNITELETAYYRGQFAALKWMTSEEKPEDGFTEESS